jgi:medium-chain acyl-[acyl-carrier-protein] hydrolase
MSANPWLQRFTPRPAARARLYCFHHAGVGAAVYRPWLAGLPAELELVAVQLPGRANRLDEPPVDRLGALVDALLPALRAEFDGKPFAFFGHSMGAVLAAELARALRDAGAPGPQQLIVSGRRPPHWPSSEPALHRLADDAFVAEIQRRYGGIPAELLQHADVMALLLPSLRADIAALETHQPPAGRAPLDCALSVFGGSDDPLTPREHLDGWRGETRGPFRVRVFPGDHFYLSGRRDALLADLSVRLAPLLTRASASSATFA